MVCNMVVNFMGIKFSWISLSFLSMIIYEVLNTGCLRYDIYSAWFLDISIYINLLSVYIHQQKR